MQTTSCDLKFHVGSTRVEARYQIHRFKYITLKWYKHVRRTLKERRYILSSCAQHHQMQRVYDIAPKKSNLLLPFPDTYFTRRSSPPHGISQRSTSVKRARDYIFIYDHKIVLQENVSILLLHFIYRNKHTTKSILWCSQYKSKYVSLYNENTIKN